MARFTLVSKWAGRVDAVLGYGPFRRVSRVTSETRDKLAALGPAERLALILTLDRDEQPAAIRLLPTEAERVAAISATVSPDAKRFVDWVIASRGSR